MVSWGGGCGWGGGGHLRLGFRCPHSSLITCLPAPLFLRTDAWAAHQAGAGLPPPARAAFESRPLPQLRYRMEPAELSEGERHMCWGAQALVFTMLRCSQRQ